MKFDNALEHFEQKMSKIISGNYSNILKELNECLSKVLKNKIYNKKGLEDSMKKEIRTLKKTLSEDDDIDVVNEEDVSIDTSYLNSRKEDQRVKRWNRITKERRWDETKENNSDSYLNNTKQKLSYQQITSYVRGTSEESNEPKNKRHRDSKSSAVSRMSKTSHDVLELDDEMQGIEKEIRADGKMKRRKTTAKEDEVTEDAGNPEEITWPPKIGSMVATLYEEGFYVGRVKDVHPKNNTVDVFYMERYKGHQERETNIDDKYWVWPEEYEVYPTEKWSVFGENIMIHLAENVASNEKAVFMLQGYQMWSNMAKSSRKGISIN